MESDGQCRRSSFDTEEFRISTTEGRPSKLIDHHSVFSITCNTHNALFTNTPGRPSTHTQHTQHTQCPAHKHTLLCTLNTCNTHTMPCAQTLQPVRTHLYTQAHTHTHQCTTHLPSHTHKSKWKRRRQRATRESAPRKEAAKQT
jgi:hypothetical protein